MMKIHFMNISGKAIAISLTQLIVISSIILLTMTDSVIAQEPKYGLVLGVNRTNIVGDDVGDVDPKLGLTLGVAGTKELENNLSLRGELVFTMKGGKSEDTFGGDTYVAWLNLNYIEIPVLLQYDFTTEESLSPWVQAGPAISYNLSAKGKSEVNGDTSEEDIGDNIKAIDFSIVVGAGIRTKIIDQKASFGLRYVFGLTSIDDSGDDDDVKNSAISLIASYEF